MALKIQLQCPHCGHIFLHHEIQAVFHDEKSMCPNCRKIIKKLEEQIKKFASPKKEAE